LKYAVKPIPRSARSGLSGQTKVPNRKKPERQGIKTTADRGQKSSLNEVESEKVIIKPPAGQYAGKCKTFFCLPESNEFQVKFHSVLFFLYLLFTFTLLSMLTSTTLLKYIKHCQLLKK
jgi:hypothetical protein